MTRAACRYRVYAIVQDMVSQRLWAVAPSTTVRVTLRRHRADSESLCAADGEEWPCSAIAWARAVSGMEL